MTPIAWQSLVIALPLLGGCVAHTAILPTQPAAGVASAECSLSAPDQAWLDDALAAWAFTSRSITGIEIPPQFEAVIFDSRCGLTSNTAMAGGPALWKAAAHSGTIELPNGQKIPAVVTSFSWGDEDRGFFVMSTPAVWRAGGVKHASLELETLMIAVLLHEGSHVAQIPTYGRRMEALAARHELPETFSDDSIQERFEANREFADSVARETDLLLAAAAAADHSQALRLAREARSAMRLRHARWFRGADSYLSEAEDIWLTMEGSGQWAGFRWLIDPQGGAVAPTTALNGFAMRGNSWSQHQGFALMRALERLTGEGWKRHAFGDGAKTAIQMLDETLSSTASPPAS